MGRTAISGRSSSAIARLNQVRSQGDAASPGLLQTRGPWQGLVHQPALSFVNQQMADQLVNLVPLNEALTQDYGWIRYEDDATQVLPLGAVGDALPAATPSPVVLLDRLVELPGITETSLALTSQLGANNGTLWKLEVTGQWVEVTDASGGGGISTLKTESYDSTFYGPGGMVVFCNGPDDSSARLYYYPDVADYDLLPMPTSAPNLTNFHCRSVTTFNEALLVLNTTEASGERHPTRFRFTRPAWSNPVAADWSEPGSGFRDFESVASEGIKVLPIGNRVALYFGRAVVFAEPTFLLNPIFVYQTLTLERGLLSTQGLVDLGSAVHFGVFSDGFFFLSESGEWQEAGFANFEQATGHKFKDFFYGGLNLGKAHRIALGYDPVRRFVYISWPNVNSNDDGDPNETWIYEIDNDRIWPQDYKTGFTNNQTALCWAVLRDIERPATAWDDATGSWISFGGDSPWISFLASLGSFDLCHGTIDGLVQQHDPNIQTWDGVNPSWRYTTHPLPFGSTSDAVQFMRRTILYRALSAAGPSVSFSIAEGLAGANLQSISANLSAVAAGVGQPNVQNFDVSTSARMPVLGLSGAHPVYLYGWEDVVNLGAGQRPGNELRGV